MQFETGEFETVYAKDPEAFPDLRKYKNVEQMTKRIQKLRVMLKKPSKATARVNKWKRELNYLVVKKFLYGEMKNNPKTQWLCLNDKFSKISKEADEHAKKKNSNILWDAINKIVETCPEFQEILYKIPQ